MSSDQLTIKSSRRMLREMIDDILEQDPQLFDHDEIKSDLLGEAVRLDDVMTATYLIDIGADLNPHNLNENPLKLALEKGSLKCIELLLKNGAKLEGPHWNGRSPAEFVFRGLNTGKSKQMLLTLLDNGLDTKYYNEELGQNLLLMIVDLLITFKDFHQDAAELVEILLNEGMSLNKPDSGCAPLLLSLRLKEIDFTSFLIKKGADVNFKNNKGYIVPICEAARLRNVKAMELLLSNGADINSKENCNSTALHIACGIMCFESISLLLLKGADITVIANYGRHDGTPLYFVSKFYLDFDLENEDRYCPSRIRCIYIMIKEIAKRKSFGRFLVSELDLVYIKKCSLSHKYFEKCENELSQMADFKFHGAYSYYWILKMSRSIKRLSKLVKNEEFVKNYKVSTSLFPYYKDDLQYLIDEAVKVKEETEMVYSRLKYLFGSYFPDLVIMKLSEYLNLNNLPLD